MVPPAHDHQATKAPLDAELAVHVAGGSVPSVGRAREILERGRWSRATDRPSSTSGGASAIGAATLNSSSTSKGPRLSPMPGTTGAGGPAACRRGGVTE